MIWGPRCFKCSLTNSGEKIVHRLRHPGGTPRTPQILLDNYSLRCQDPLAPDIISTRQTPKTGNQPLFKPQTPYPPTHHAKPKQLQRPPATTLQKSFHIILLTPIGKKHVESSRWGRVVQKITQIRVTPNPRNTII